MAPAHGGRVVYDAEAPEWWTLAGEPRPAWLLIAAGTGVSVSDYSERGAAPVEDGAVEDPPTVDEVLERQRIEHPDQARTSTMQPATTDEEAATADAAGEIADQEPDGGVDIEGPNSA